MLTVDELRGHVTTDLDDDALGLLLDAAYEAIDDYAGTGGTEDYPATVTELLTTSGDLLMLSRRASAILSVSEGASTPTTLAADDYELIGEQMLRRERNGTHSASRWGGRVKVTYTALPDENARDLVAIGLVKLDTQYTPGVQSERLGDHAVTFAFGQGSSSTYAQERRAILGSLHSGFVAK